MLFFLLGYLFVISTVLAAPSTVTRRACQAVLHGNLSPNSVSGNFKLVNGVLAFDPTNVVTEFPISVQSCSSTSAQPKHLVAGSTGQCLAAHNGTATHGPTVAGVDCATATDDAVVKWAMSNGALYWSGATTASCPSGLYGYKAVSSSGTPSAVQKAPVTLECSTASNVYGFSVLA